jgi:hypothetical protein
MSAWKWSPGRKQRQAVAGIISDTCELSTPL